MIVLEIITKYKRFIKYCIIGASGVLLDFLVFYILNKIFGVYYQVANFISVSCGITNNFLLNARFNFKTRDRLAVRYLIFYAVGMTGILISSLLLYIFIEKLGFDVILTKLIILFVVTIIQYTLNKSFSFGRFREK
jgi:putative flippase GtrA